MSNDVEKTRIEAVKRYLSSGNARSVAQEFGRSRQWLHKWVKRYRECDEFWFMERPRTPRFSPRKTGPGTECLILEVRERLENTKYAQIGACAIAWELKKLGASLIPGPWTINRILSQNGKVRKRGKYEPRKTPCPNFSGEQPNHLHQGDLVGPRYIKGDGRFYSLNVMDIFRHKIALSPIRTMQDYVLVESLLSVWRRLGTPRYFQIDNANTYRGSNRFPRSFGEVVKLCLSLKIEPVFIPVREPWRNPEIERFQDTFDKKFFRAQEFSSFEGLLKEARAFEEFHNENHCYSCLKGKTPLGFEETLSFSPVFPPLDFKVPMEIPANGKIHLVRLIRSDTMLDVFTEKFKVPPELAYQYVTATINVEEQKMDVVHDGEVVCTFEYRTS